MTNLDRIDKNQASVLFSGGTDSTLAAVEMLKVYRKVTLLTFNPGFILFVNNSKVHADDLKRMYGEDRVEHKLITISDATRMILFNNIKRDLAKYGFNMAALVCMGCRLSMHARAIIFNLENEIPILADGSIKKQSAIPEQMQSVIKRNREVYSSEYGLAHVSPIYDEEKSDVRLHHIGIGKSKRLKRQFILFDTQATCPFGVTADIYARIFYHRIMGKDAEREVEVYCREKYPLMKRYVGEYFSQRDVNVNELVEKLRKKRKQ